MKRIFALSALCFAFVAATFAQEHKKPLSPPDSVENSLVKIDFSKPSVKGRKIFGAGKDYLQPYGTIWRIGANKATTIEAKQNITFGGQTLKAGTYALYAIPDASEWTIIVNGNPNQWGTEYEKNKDKDLFSVKVKPTALPSLQETMSIALKGHDIVIRWENTEVKVPIKKA